MPAIFRNNPVSIEVERGQFQVTDGCSEGINPVLSPEHTMELLKESAMRYNENFFTPVLRHDVII